MKINVEDLKQQQTITISEKISFDGRDTKDALIKNVNFVDVNMTAIVIEEDEFHLTIDYVADVKYLDCRNLKPLDLRFDFHDDIIFSSHSQKAEEFEFEYFEGDEIELDDLLFDLTCVRIPVSYSEDNDSDIKKESELQFENKPFADIFNK